MFANVKVDLTLSPLVVSGSISCIGVEIVDKDKKRIIFGVGRTFTVRSCETTFKFAARVFNKASFTMSVYKFCPDWLVAVSFFLDYLIIMAICMKMLIVSPLA